MLSQRVRIVVFRLVAACAVVAVGTLAVSGCGNSDSDPAPPPDYAKDLAGSPAPLAALHAQGNELLDGGKTAFEEQLGKLKGFPVVVNVWGSWCGPCIAEFPYFQQASAKLGKKVAFVGVNSEDSKDLATKLLEDYPIPYPSFVDQNNDIFDSLVSARGLPATVFFDSSGKQTFARRGGYPDQEALMNDIQNYAVEGNSG